MFERFLEEFAFRLIASKLDAMFEAYPSTPEEDEYELTQAAGRQAGRVDARRGGTSAVNADGRRAAALCAALLEKRLLSATLGVLSNDVQIYVQSQHEAPPGNMSNGGDVQAAYEREAGIGGGAAPTRGRRKKKRRKRGAKEEL